MKEKIWGIMISLLGIAGLIWAFIYINGPEVNEHLPVLFAAGIFGAAAFFTGIWLVDRKRVRQGARVADSNIQRQSA